MLYKWYSFECLLNARSERLLNAPLASLARWEVLDQSVHDLYDPTPLYMISF